MPQHSSPSPRPFVDCGTCRGRGFVTITRTRGVSMDMNASGPFETVVATVPNPNICPASPWPLIYTIERSCAICAGRGTMFLHPAELRARVAA